MQFTKSKPVLVMAVVCVGILISSQAALAHGNSERNNGTDSGMMGGQYGSGMMGNLAMLDLTDEQVGKITKEQDRFRKEAWEIMGLELDQQPILREALSADVPDPTAVGQAYGKLFELKRQMIEEKIISANKIRSLLDEDQVNKLKKAWSQPNRFGDNTHSGKGSGMGSNMMQGKEN